MIKFTAVTRGLDRFQRDLKTENSRQVKAMDTAVRVEGYQLRRSLIKEIREGAPGGQRFEPLSMLTRSTRKRTRPLYPLIRHVRYKVPRRSPIEMSVGFTDVSTKFARLIQRQQEGYEYRSTPRQRRFLAGRGGKMKRSKYKPFHFIRKETGDFKTPARPIIEPFWRRYEPQSRINITSNFVRKLRGERI